MALLLALLPDEIALSRLRRALEVDRASRALRGALREFGDPVGVEQIGGSDPVDVQPVQSLITTPGAEIVSPPPAAEAEGFFKREQDRDAYGRPWRRSGRV
jgi:hypothetical protein